jgi:uridine kinase
VANPVLIAISGGSGSGKTTLATALANRLGPADCLIVSDDDYYRGRPAGEAFDPDRFNFDDPSSKDLAMLGAHLARLRAGEVIERPKYDMRTHSRLAQTVAVAPRPFIIVEGIHVLSGPFSDVFDLTVFVETPADVRLARRVLRDIAHRGRPVEEVVHRYIEFVRPSHIAHTQPGSDQAHVIVRDDSCAIAAHEGEALAIMDGLLEPVMAKLVAIRPAVNKQG